MKAPIIEIKRFAVHDGDGIRTTVFLKGCPLRCLWCHNPEGLRATPEIACYESKCVSCLSCATVCKAGAHKEENGKHVFLREACIGCGDCEAVCPASALKHYGRGVSPEELLPILLEDRDFYETSGGGVTVSGGECLLYPDFVSELLQLLKGQGIRTAVDTCGHVPRAAIDKVLPYTDVFLYDVKAIDDAVHVRCTGVSNRQILENLHYLDQMQKEIEVRIPFVPGYNDGELEAIGALLSGLRSLKKVRVLPYHRFAGSKYEALGIENTLPEEIPTEEAVKSARAYLRSLGLTVLE